MADSICARCFHNYVCEQFNEDRDYKNQECRYLNSHFVDVDSVEPVRHGHWRKEPFLMGTTHRCNLCGENYGMPHGIFNYCPNCGAKMDGVSE